MNLLPAAEIRPFAHLSPPPDIQAAQLAALFALRRTSAPLVVTSVEALMMRTLAMRTFGVLSMKPSRTSSPRASTRASASVTASIVK